SIQPGNISVAENGGGGALNVSGVSVSPSGADAPTLTATYTVDAPAGGWTSNADGTYVVSFNTSNGNAVTDTSGNAPLIALPSAFAVEVPEADTTPPTATITTGADITTSGGTTQTITVLYV